MNTPSLLDIIADLKLRLDRSLPENRPALQEEHAQHINHLACLSKMPVEACERLANFWFVKYAENLCKSVKGQESFKIESEEG